MALAAEAVGHLPNVTVRGFNALVVDFAREIGAVAVVKGLRAISDFDYEFQMAQFNKQLADDIETVYLPASAQYSFLSSSGVREVAAWGGSVDAWVPRNVATALSERLERSGGQDGARVHSPGRTRTPQGLHRAGRLRRRGRDAQARQHRPGGRTIHTPPRTGPVQRHGSLDAVVLR